MFLDHIMHQFSHHEGFRRRLFLPRFKRRQLEQFFHQPAQSPGFRQCHV